MLWHFTVSLDGFVAGPGHDMSWLTGFEIRPGLIEAYVGTTGAIVAGRVDLHVAPVLLDEGIRLLADAGGPPVRMERVVGDRADPVADPVADDVRYRPLPLRG